VAVSDPAASGQLRVLIVRLSAFGDCLHAVPVVVALRRHMPNAVIGWAIEELSHSLLKGHPMVDQFHVFPRHAFKQKRGNLFERMRSMQRFRREIADMKYDVAIDLQGLTKSGLVSWWSGAKRRIGFKGEESREFNLVFNNERVVPPEHAVHVVEKNLALLRPLNVRIPDKPEWVLPDFAEEFEQIKPFLTECGLVKNGSVSRFAVVNPGATWFTKRWPPESFGEVSRELIKRHDLKVVIPWAGQDELKAAKTIAEVAGTGAFVAPDTNLRQLASLTKRATLFVGNDTGPLHLAVAANVPSVAIFGATDPLRNGPYGSMHRMQTGGVDCHPCWKTTCERKDRACLILVRPEMVLESCAHILKRIEGAQGTAAAC
jgi:lipopolysaccharide heptosyltransferase I